MKNINRRNFVKRSSVGTLGAATLGLSNLSFTNESAQHDKVAIERPREVWIAAMTNTGAQGNFKEKIDAIPAKVSQRGEVLIAYSDCHSCHAVDKRMKGPAFKDIAKRYPVQEQYVALLAQRIIIGGSGSWGYSVMTPHPDVKEEDAKTMVKFILSLKE